MTREATVVRTSDGKLMAKFERTEACARCGACAFGKKETALYPLPSGTYQVGDTVELKLPDDAAFKASIIGYGIPILTLLLGLLIGVALGLPDLMQAVLALVGVALGWVALRLLEPRIKRSGRFGVRACPEDRSDKL